MTAFFQPGSTQKKTLIILTILAVSYTLYFARGFLIPIFLALLLSVILQPLVIQMTRLRIPPGVGAAVVLVAATAILLWGAYELATPAADWLKRGPEVRAELEKKFRKVTKPLKEARETTQRLEEIAKPGGQKREAPVVAHRPDLLSRIVDRLERAAVTLGIMLILIFFLLARGEDTLQRIARQIAPPEKAERWSQVVVQLERDISVYLRTVAMINSAVGLATAAAMALLGVPAPLLWGAVVAVLKFLPYVGPLLTIVILSAVSLLTFDTLTKIILPPLVYLIIDTIEAQLVTPVIMGRRFAMDPVFVFISLLFWTWIWGVAGTFLAIPLLTALQIIAQNVESLRPVRALLELEK